MANNKSESPDKQVNKIEDTGNDSTNMAVERTMMAADRNQLINKTSEIYRTFCKRCKGR